VTYVTREQRNAVDVKAGACSAVQNALPLALGSKATRYLQATAVSSTTFLQLKKSKLASFDSQPSNHAQDQGENC
jgi:hypothetical protein